MDIDTIRPGEDFVQAIENAVGSCEILIAIIGRHWLTKAGEEPNWLHNPNDFVRLEIAAALSRDVRVIPVLVQKASMPNPQDLTEDLIQLARRNAVELTDLHWQRDVDQLIGVLEKVLSKQIVPVAVEASSTAGLGDSRLSLETATPPAALPRTVMDLAKKSRLTLVIGLVALMVIIGIALFIWRARRPAGQNPSTSSNQTQIAQQASSPAQNMLPPAATSTPSGTVANMPAPVLSTPPQHLANRIGIEFVWIKPGMFTMGSTNGEPDEQPAHQVTIKEGFYLGKYEVTQAQWEAVMGKNPSWSKECGGNCPVDGVSWDDVQKFIDTLNSHDDQFKYRLPTEAEWEYACRAGTTGDYAGPLKEMAWYSENSGNTIHAVGLKHPNAWGLADMHGNVWEWCEDWYHDDYDGAPTDGSAWLRGEDLKTRVLRGGSWTSDAAYEHSANRSKSRPSRGYNYDGFGFRLVAVART